MSYLDNFEHSFMQHTLKNVQTYKGSFDATTLINCLLGLLVLPKEKFLEAIPSEPLSKLSKWGISPNSIRNAGRKTTKNPQPNTLRGLVYNLRNSVAHFHLKPIPRTKEVCSFEFTDNEFHAVIKIKELRDFVERLADHLDKH